VVHSKGGGRGIQGISVRRRRGKGSKIDDVSPQGKGTRRGHRVKRGGKKGRGKPQVKGTRSGQRLRSLVLRKRKETVFREKKKKHRYRVEEMD